MRRSRGDGWPSLPLAGAHLATLWSLAFAQPLFDLLGRNAAFFVARDNTAGDILILAFGYVIVPPAALTALVALAGRVAPALGRALLALSIGLLTSAIALQALKRALADDSTLLIPLAAALGIAAAAAYARRAGARSVLTMLAPAPAIVLALFLVFSPTAQLVMPREAEVQASPGAPSRTPVVLVIFDELPAMSLMDEQQRIDAKRYPSFGRLAAASTWYRNATTVADGTYRALPPIFTGLRPAEKVPTSRAFPHSVFTMLGRGYDQHVVEPITRVCPSTLCGPRAREAMGKRLGSLASDLGVVVARLLLPNDLARSLPPVDRDWQDFAAAEDDATIDDDALGSPSRVAGDDTFARRLRTAQSVIRSIRAPARRPPLYMLHVVLPHVPWRFLPDGRQYPVDGPNLPGLTDQTWTRNPVLLREALQRHLLQLGMADRVLGELMDRLRAGGLWDRSLVIVAADHGGSVRPGGSRRPVTRANFPDVAGVPFFVKLPGQRDGGRIDDRPVLTLDVLPTIAKAVGADLGWKADGKPVDEPHRDTLLRVRNGRRAKEVVVRLEDFERMRAAQLQRQHRLLPPGASLYRSAELRGLVGRRVRTLARAPTGERVSIDGAGRFARVRPRGGVIPAYVSGSFTAGGHGGERLAVAVNGRIRAVVRAYPLDGHTRFSAIVPPWSLHAGRNLVEVFAVDPGGALQPLGHAGG